MLTRRCAQHYECQQMLCLDPGTLRLCINNICTCTFQSPYTGISNNRYRLLLIELTAQMRFSYLPCLTVNLCALWITFFSQILIHCEETDQINSNVPLEYILPYVDIKIGGYIERRSWRFEWVKLAVTWSRRKFWGLVSKQVRREKSFPYMTNHRLSENSVILQIEVYTKTID